MQQEMTTLVRPGLFIGQCSAGAVAEGISGKVWLKFLIRLSDTPHKTLHVGGRGGRGTKGEGRKKHGPQTSDYGEACMRRVLLLTAAAGLVLGNTGCLINAY